MAALQDLSWYRMDSHPLWSARLPDLSACDLSIGKFERNKTHIKTIHTNRLCLKKPSRTQYPQFVDIFKQYLITVYPSSSISVSDKLFWTYHVSKCKAIKLTVPQASVFNWIPCANIRSQMCVAHICDLIFVLDFYLPILPRLGKKYQNIPCFLTHKVF